MELHHPFFWCVYIYIYIYINMCIYVCVLQALQSSNCMLCLLLPWSSAGTSDATMTLSIRIVQPCSGCQCVPLQALTSLCERGTMQSWVAGLANLHAGLAVFRHGVHGRAV